MIDYPQNDPPVQGHADRMVEIAEAREALMSQPIFVVVVDYIYDGHEVVGAYWSQEEADTAVAKVKEDRSWDLAGWIKFEGGICVESRPANLKLPG